MLKIKGAEGRILFKIFLLENEATFYSKWIAGR